MVRMERRDIIVEQDYWRIRVSDQKLAAAERSRLLEYLQEIRCPYRKLGGELCLPAAMSPAEVLELLRFFYDGIAEVHLRRG
jgi:hypothetical protein